MSTNNELKWTPYHVGEIHQWKAESKSGRVYKVMQLECKNEYGNEWALFLPDKNEPLGFRTEKDAKDRAEQEDRNPI